MFNAHSTDDGVRPTEMENDMQRPALRHFTARRAITTMLAVSAMVACNTHEVTPFSENIKAENADTFAQAGAAQVDILWVVDNSGSMCEEQNDLRENFDRFIEELDGIGADFRLAVVTTDMENPEESGRFQNVPDGAPGPSCQIAVDISACPTPENGQEYPPLVLSSQDYRNPDGSLDKDRLKLHFGCNASVGTTGTGFEMGLESAKEALSPALLSNFNSGFLREGAFLAVIFLTDENDCSDRGALDKTNGNICEWESGQLVPVEDYVNFFTQLKGGDPSKVIMAGIIAPDTGVRYMTGQEVQPSCFSDAGGDGFAGYRYGEVIESFENNAIANICLPPFDDALGALGALIGDTIEISCLSAPPLTCDTAADCPGDQECATRSAGERKFCSGFRVQVEIRRPTPLEVRGASRECEPIQGSDRLSCLLVEGEDYTVNFADSQCGASGISVDLNYDLESADELIYRYPREVASNALDDNPAGEEESDQ